MQTTNPYIEELVSIQKEMMNALHLSYAEAALVAVQHIKNMNINEMFEIFAERLDTVIELLGKEKNIANQE
jgi:hypothetical protein